MAENNRPLHDIRLGRIKCAIWANSTDNGTQYNATFVRVYRLPEKDRGNRDNGWRESSSFGRDDLLTLAEVSRQAACWIHAYQKRQSDSRMNESQEQPEEDFSEAAA